MAWPGWQTGKSEQCFLRNFSGKVTSVDSRGVENSELLGWSAQGR